MGQDRTITLIVAAIILSAAACLAVYLVSLRLPDAPWTPPQHRVERECWVDFAGDRICE